MYLKAFACLTKGGSWRLREALAQVMGKHKHQKETRNGQQKQLLTVLVLTSILGLGAYVPRAGGTNHH